MAIGVDWGSYTNCTYSHNNHADSFRWMNEYMAHYYKTTKTTKKVKITTMMKRILDADTQTLVKARLLDSDLNVTDAGRKELISLLFLAHKDDLVKVANEKLEEEKKD